MPNTVASNWAYAEVARSSKTARSRRVFMAQKLLSETVWQRHTHRNENGSITSESKKRLKKRACHRTFTTDVGDRNAGTIERADYAGLESSNATMRSPSRQGSIAAFAQMIRRV